MTVIRDALESAFTNANGDVSLSRLSEVLSEWKTKRIIKAFLQDLVSDEEALLSITRQSYRHDNGFWKIVVAQYRTVKLRLHIWNNLSRSLAGDSNIHNHRWDFSSLLLCGGYRQQIFSLCDSDAGDLHVSHFQYYPQGIGAERVGEDYLHLKGETSLRLIEDRVWNSPEIVAVSFTTLHRILIREDSFVASLFLQGADRCGFTNVYCEAEPARIKPDETRVISTRELSDALSLLIRMLSQNLQQCLS